MLKRKGVFVVMAVVLVISMCVLGQDAASVSEQVQETAVSVLDQSLTYIDSAASLLGQGALYLLNLITDGRVSADLEKPIGYLALITLILLLFGIIDFARKVIWIGIIVGWALLVVRIVLDALRL